METTKIDGQLEIDHDRGVIYFHSNLGHTVLRICNLPTPIPKDKVRRLDLSGLDITHFKGTNWLGEIRIR